MNKKYKRCNLCQKLFLPNPNLKKVHKICLDCKTIRLSRNIEVSKIYKNLKKNPPTPADDELFFEDDTSKLEERVSKLETKLDRILNILDKKID